MAKEFSYEYFMEKALEEAKKSELEEEVPIGAVVVFENQIISTGRNKRETTKNALHHAEIEAIYKACKKLNRWRLIGCSIYVTLEPCPMCAGAIINSRIEKVVYGTSDPKAGSCGTIVNLFDLPYNHKPIVVKDILKTECSSILTEFFKKLRNR